MDRDVIGEIKKRLDIVDLVGDYVQLRKVGRNYRALCPFHTEKTPSFYVSPERQTYHCFGCGKGGDAFTFLMEIEGVSFPQALERLAKRAGVTLSKSARPKAEGDLSEVIELALKFYRDALHSPSGEVARSYLKHRELPPEVWETFELGWAPPSWDYLWQSLQRHGVTFELAERCGLVLMGSRSPYDRFRGRVMFPVRDVSGKLVAFGGRLVVGEGAKYINSPESELFQKRNCLYLLERAKKSIRQRGRSILVEGYIDAIRLHISGYPETVASLGTSLT
ncbi:MAG TPA: DNA primase, partial [Thermosynergistes sp.]|nr:DNA primase [Thermosynergistes sp.]